tara:strand:- start:2433 stop:2708 length:276 start_codon:yes stop_codon:yes gene_type:complete
VKFFLFKFFLKLAVKLAPSKEVANSLSQRLFCLERQMELDKCVRPRTETYEWLTTKDQRELYLEGKLIRGNTRDTRRHYTDYDEAQEYHNS